MKKEMTKGQVRTALCYLVGWLTENSTERKVAGMKEICSSAFPAKEDAEACMQVFRAMLTGGWARKNGCNRAAIYTASCNTPKLDSDYAISWAMEELTPLIEEAGVKVTAESESESLRRIEEIERTMDSLPEPVTEKPLEKCTETEEKPLEKCTKVCENTPKVCENSPEKCDEEDTIRDGKCENNDGKADGEREEPFSIPWNAIRDLAKSSPAILVTMLRGEGWEVTARKTVTYVEEL